MADKVTTTKTLKIVTKYVDGDTRTIDVDNPKADLTAAQINAVGAIAKANNLLLGDKNGADFLEFDTAKVIEKEHTVLDLR